MWRDYREEKHCSYDYYVVPLVNPRGYEYALTHDERWEKTIGDGNGGCTGVNLLTQFHYNSSMFDEAATDRRYNDPCSDYYHGNSFMSEPETSYQSMKESLRIGDLEKMNKINNNILSVTLSGKSRTLSYAPAYAEKYDYGSYSPKIEEPARYERYIEEFAKAADDEDQNWSSGVSFEKFEENTYYKLVDQTYGHPLDYNQAHYSYSFNIGIEPSDYPNTESGMDENSEENILEFVRGIQAMIEFAKSGDWHNFLSDFEKYSDMDSKESSLHWFEQGTR